MSPSDAPAQPTRHASGRGFTLIELLVVIAIIGVLGSILLPALGNARKQSQSIRCLSNLKQLGSATAMYLDDNSDNLPYAVIHFDDSYQLSMRDMTFDDLLNSYLGGTMTLEEKWSPFPQQEMKVLRCPTDNNPLGRPELRGFLETLMVKPNLFRRSYTMPMYQDGTVPVQWPPDSTAQTGVGLNWYFSSSTVPLGWNGEDSSKAPPYPSKQRSIRVSMIHEAAGTILYTEYFHVDNLQGYSERAVLRSAAAHYATPGGVFNYDKTKHHGKDIYNYQFIDGHAESLDFHKTTPGITQRRGMWSILAGD